MDAILSILGVLGAVACVGAYFLLERGVFRADGMAYYAANGVGAVLILIAALYEFDGGDMGVVVQEICWITVSAMGMWKVRGLAK